MNHYYIILFYYKFIRLCTKCVLV